TDLDLLKSPPLVPSIMALSIDRKSSWQTELCLRDTRYGVRLTLNQSTQEFLAKAAKKMPLLFDPGLFDRILATEYEHPGPILRESAPLEWIEDLDLQIASCPP